VLVVGQAPRGAPRQHVIAPVVRPRRSRCQRAVIGRSEIVIDSGSQPTGGDPHLFAKIQRPPSTYLKEFYYDTVNFNQGALKLAIDFAGADHILAGSDYPHQIGSIPLMIEAIDKLPVSDEQREGIRWKNAARLLGLERVRT